MRDPRYAAEHGGSLDEIADDFRRRDVEHLAGNRSRVRRTWAEMTRDAEERHPLQARVIRKQAALRRGHLPLRRLLDQAPDVLFAVKPCWAMSPLMVSQVLPAARLFDVVIFDEASQIVPADAIPSIIRAHQVVVAGDDHQLPPTSFFRQFGDAGAEDEDDEDTVSFEAGFESVLDTLRPLLPDRGADLALPQPGRAPGGLLQRAHLRRHADHVPRRAARRLPAARGRRPGRLAGPGRLGDRRGDPGGRADPRARPHQAR